MSTIPKSLGELNITVGVKEITKDLTLREYVGDGEFDGHKFKISSAIPTFNPIVEIEGRLFRVAMQEIIRNVVGGLYGWVSEKEEENVS